jgi:hypothetical protein
MGKGAEQVEAAQFSDFFAKGSAHAPLIPLGLFRLTPARIPFTSLFAA